MGAPGYTYLAKRVENLEASLALALKELDRLSPATANEVRKLRDKPREIGVLKSARRS